MNNDLRHAIIKAIDKEKKSYDMYLRFIKEIDNHNAHRMFNTLALEELKHEALLKDCLNSGDFRFSKNKFKGRFDDLEIMSKLHPTADIDAIRDVFILALKKEVEAKDGYDRLTEMADSPALKDLFIFLRNEELHHERLIRKEYDKL